MVCAQASADAYDGIIGCWLDNVFEQNTGVQHRVISYILLTIF